jgi:hypothetical protein
MIRAARALCSSLFSSIISISPSVVVMQRKPLLRNNFPVTRL